MTKYENSHRHNGRETPFRIGTSITGLVFIWIFASHAFATQNGASNITNALSQITYRIYAKPTDAFNEAYGAETPRTTAVTELDRRFQKIHQLIPPKHGQKPAISIHISTTAPKTSSTELQSKEVSHRYHITGVAPYGSPTMEILKAEAEKRENQPVFVKVLDYGIAYRLDTVAGSYFSCHISYRLQDHCVNEVVAAALRSGLSSKLVYGQWYGFANFKEVEYLEPRASTSSVSDSLRQCRHQNIGSKPRKRADGRTYRQALFSQLNQCVALFEKRKTSQSARSYDCEKSIGIKVPIALLEIEEGRNIHSKLCLR